MDAKPTRPVRTAVAARKTNENAPLATVLPGKQIKQNDKVAPSLPTALPTLMHAGLPRAGIKRAALGDKSNQPLAAQDDHGKDSKSVGDLKQSAAALLKPAQKLLTTKVAVQSVTAVQEPAAIPHKLVSKRGPSVLKDDPIAVDGEPDHVRAQEDTTNDELDLAAGAVQPADNHLIVALEHQAQSLEDDKLGLAESQEAAYETETEDDEYYQDFDADEATRNLTAGATALTIVLGPRFTQRDLNELNEAKIMVETSRTAEDIEEEMWDLSMVAEYGEEIFAYMLKLEEKMRPNARYMDFQQDIQWSMRSVLVDWVIQVHHRFQLLPETLFLAINYMDRFLSVKVVSMGKLQLVGATALFLAAKYEEVNCPSIAEIVYMVDNGYSVEEILKAERFMLSMLHFELGWPGPMSFLRRISKADDYDLETRTLAKYFLEITICDERFLECTPSFTAAGAQCLARLMLTKGDWTMQHIYYSGYTYGQIYPLLVTLVDCLHEPETHHNAVFQKYGDKRFKRASTFVRNQMVKGFKLQPFR